MYQALYRKWRPQTFDDVVGQEQVTQTLKNQIINGKLSHAYLFVGTRGTGKTTCAKLLARAVNCENPQNGNPCNKCKSCLGIEDGSIMDVLEMDAASNNGVENVRALRDEAVFSPAIVKKRVYIIDEVHMLSTSAFNALLKILEEPPEHLMFILATTELNKVPATILSRCQRHSFRRVSRDVIAARLSYVAEQEKLPLMPDAAALLARLADGSVRDGLSLLDQCSAAETISADSILLSMRLAENTSVSEIFSYISQGDTSSALELFNTLWQEGKTPASMLSQLATLMRDLLLTQLAPKGGVSLLSGSYDDKQLSMLSKKLTAQELINALDSISACIGRLRDGRDPKLAAELCLISLSQPQTIESLDAMRARLSRVEAQLSGAMVAASSPAPQPAVEALREIPVTVCEPPPWEPEDIPAPPITDSSPPEEAAPAPLAQPSPSVPEPENKAQGADSSDDACVRFISELKKAVPVFLQVHLKDAVCRISGGQLIIAVDNSFKLNQLEQHAQQAIRSTAAEVFGSPLPFKLVEEKNTNPPAESKLDGLSRFGNVKFE